MATFEVAYDFDVWLPVPPAFPTKSGESSEEWMKREATLHRARGFPDDGPGGWLDGRLKGYLDAAQNLSGHDATWALVTVEVPGTVIVVLDAQDATGSFDELVSGLAATTDFQYDKPDVRAVQAKSLGEGICVTRRDFDENKRIYLSVYFVFRTGNADFALSTQLADPALLDRSLPFIQELLDGVTISEDDG